MWVSGSQGRLGTEVCRQLAEAGHSVVGADIKPGITDPVDLLDRRAVADSLRDAEAIVHCAGISSPEGVEPAELVRVNTMTTFNALEEAWSAGIRTAVLASSGSIYGTAWSPDPIDQPYLPVDEDSPLQYVDPYALSKDFLYCPASQLRTPLPGTAGGFDCARAERVIGWLPRSRWRTG